MDFIMTNVERWKKIRYKSEAHDQEGFNLDGEN